jgi:hypothetical protein
MIKAFWLYTGPDGNSHVQRGSIADHSLIETDSTFFKETPAHSSSDWHNDPLSQYVITIAGILEFATQRGESFTIHPGDILLMMDHYGSGHKWRLINDEPWKRVCVVLRAGADTQFVPDLS